MQVRSQRYVVLTAARNEERFLGATIDSVAAQTVKPVRWVIVSDNSTDRTDDIVNEAAREHPWIVLLRASDGGGLGFHAKANAIAAGYASVRDLEFDVVANLDADVTFEPDYSEYLLERLAEDGGLGVVGTSYSECGRKRRARATANKLDVPGQVQFWRRECWDAVGGYEPLPRGGVDTVAVTKARMLGWRTGIFLDRSYVHHRLEGTGGRGERAAGIMRGERAYLLGGRPAWETARAISHLVRKPYVLVAVWELYGYWRALISRQSRVVSNDVIAFRHKERSDRIRHLAASVFYRVYRPRAHDSRDV